MISTSTIRPAPLPFSIRTAAGWCAATSDSAAADSWCGLPATRPVNLRSRMPDCEKCRVRVAEVRRCVT